MTIVTIIVKRPAGADDHKDESDASYEGKGCREPRADPDRGSAPVSGAWRICGGHGCPGRGCRDDPWQSLQPVRLKGTSGRGGAGSCVRCHCRQIWRERNSLRVCRKLPVTAPSGHSRNRLCHRDTWLRGPSPGQCDAADVYGGSSASDGAIDALVESQGAPKTRGRGFGDRRNNGRRYDSSSRRRRSGAVRSDTGSVPRAIKPGLRLDSRRLKGRHRDRTSTVAFSLLGPRRAAEIGKLAPTRARRTHHGVDGPRASRCQAVVVKTLRIADTQDLPLSEFPPCNRKLFFLPSDLIPCFPQVFFDFAHFLPGVVLHLKKHRAGGSIIGVWKIESSQERASARAYLGRSVATARHPGAGTCSHPRDCGILIHPAGPSLRDVL